MTFTWRRFAAMQRTKSAGALVGGAAVIALVASALAAMGPDDAASASRVHGGSNNTAEFSSPSETPMILGATTSVPEAPGTAPAIARAEPAVKAHH